MRRSFVGGLGVALAVAVSWCVAPDASAAPLPPITLSDTVIENGQSITFSGSGCFPNGLTLVGLTAVISNGQSSMNPDLQPGVVQSDGTWSFTVDFTDNTGLGFVAGEYLVQVVCLDYGTQGTAYPDAHFIITPGANPTIDGSLTVSDAIVTPGQLVTVAGTQFSNANDVGFFLYSDPVFVGSATPTQTGDASASLVIPAGTAPGQHQIVGQGRNAGSGSGDSLLTKSVTITVEGTSAQATTTTTTARPVASLARTGTDHALPLSGLGLTLVVSGTVLVTFVVRAEARRSRPRHAAGG